MTMKCCMCECVGITESDADEASRIVGPGYDALCIPCAEAEVRALAAIKARREARRWQVRTYQSGLTVTRREHASYRAAVEQARLLHGYVKTPSGYPDKMVWAYASQCWDFGGDFTAWQDQGDEERMDYEERLNIV